MADCSSILTGKDSKLRSNRASETKPLTSAEATLDEVALAIKARHSTSGSPANIPFDSI